MEFKRLLIGAKPKTNNKRPAANERSDHRSMISLLRWWLKFIVNSRKTFTTQISDFWKHNIMECNGKRKRNTKCEQKFVNDEILCLFAWHKFATCFEAHDVSLHVSLCLNYFIAFQFPNTFSTVNWTIEKTILIFFIHQKENYFVLHSLDTISLTGNLLFSFFLLVFSLENAHEKMRIENYAHFEQLISYIFQYLHHVFTFIFLVFVLFSFRWQFLSTCSCFWSSHRLNSTDEVRLLIEIDFHLMSHYTHLSVSCCHAAMCKFVTSAIVYDCDHTRVSVDARTSWCARSLMRLRPEVRHIVRLTVEHAQFQFSFGDMSSDFAFARAHARTYVNRNGVKSKKKKKIPTTCKQCDMKMLFPRLVCWRLRRRQSAKLLMRKLTHATQRSLSVSYMTAKAIQS